MPSFFVPRQGSDRGAARRAAARGFTLPELLVTMAIIGTLATVGTVSYSSVRAAARDVKRVSDMKQLQTAIELYFENHNTYPGDEVAGNEGLILGEGENLTLSDAGFGPKVVGTPYMVRVPRNPQPFGSPYVYRALGADGRNCESDACGSYAILFTTEKTQGNYLAGPHAMTPAGIAGAEGGYAGEGITTAGQQIVGIEAVQAQLDVIASNATTRVQQFVSDKKVQTVAEVAVAPTIATVAVANTALTTTSAASYIALFLTQPFALFGRRKRKAWGTVYNAFSRLPEDLVIVRLRDASSNRIVKSTVTDMQGRYSFLAQRGAYRIEVAKARFTFPSQVTAGKKEDGPFVDLYHGEVIEVGPDGAILTPNIPIDPASGDESDAVVLKQERWNRLHKGVAILSPTLGGITLLIRPSAFVALLFAAQIVVYFLFRRLAEPPQPKNWGIVYEQGSSKPVPQAVLRIFEAKYNKLLETQVTDRQGRYHFRVGQNVYYVTVTKPGYLKTQTDALDLTKVNEATVIASDLPLAPAQGGTAAAPPPAAEGAKPGYAPAKASPAPAAAAASPDAKAEQPAAAIPQATTPPAPPPPPEMPAIVSPAPPPPAPPKEPAPPSEPPPPPAPPKEPPPKAWFRDI